MYTELVHCAQPRAQICQISRGTGHDLVKWQATRSQCQLRVDFVPPECTRQRHETMIRETKRRITRAVVCCTQNCIAGPFLLLMQYLDALYTSGPQKIQCATLLRTITSARLSEAATPWRANTVTPLQAPGVSRHNFDGSCELLHSCRRDIRDGPSLFRECRDDGATVQAAFPRPPGAFGV